MAIRIIRHEAVPKCGSFEVRFADGRASRFFYWDDLPCRRLLPETRAMLEALIGPFDEHDLDAALEQAATLHSSFPDVIPALFGITIAPTRLVGSSARNVISRRFPSGVATTYNAAFIRARASLCNVYRPLRY